jgi:hypothetical protein
MRFLLIPTTLIWLLLWSVAVYMSDLQYPVSKRYKRAVIANGSATIITDPIFEIFQNLADILLEDYHIVNDEIAKLDKELEFYQQEQESNQVESVLLKECAVEMKDSLESIKNGIYEKHLEFVTKIGFHYRSVFMMFTPIGKFEQPYRVFQKISTFWSKKIIQFVPHLLGTKLTILLLLFIASFF